MVHVSHFTTKFNGMMSDNNNNNNDGEKNDSKVSWLILSENDEKNVNRPSSYRLAYRYVASSANNNNNDNVDVNNDNDKPVVLFCNGFRSASVLGGTKVNAVEEYCKINNIDFCCFDYRGHGLSSGNFNDMTLSNWIEDTRTIITQILHLNLNDNNNTVDNIQNKKQRIILVGSSMGAWISIHIALLFNNNSNENIQVNTLKHGKNQTVYIDGIIGIAAAAPDFIQDLW